MPVCGVIASSNFALFPSFCGPKLRPFLPSPPPPSCPQMREGKINNAADRNNARNDDGSRRWDDKACCGFVETMEKRREQRFASNKPRPWLERKFMVGIVYAIVGYTWYVYVGRLCVPMIKRHGDALGDRAMGSTCSSSCFSFGPSTDQRDFLLFLRF